jgi:hypothetical protein
MDSRIRQAFESAEPKTSLFSLVHSLKAAGLNQSSVLELFEQARREFRESDREIEEDIVMDVMDCIVGWCSPQARLFPENTT